MLDLRRNKVRRQTLRDVSHGGVGHQANLLDVLVMISHEADVGRHCPEIFPSGKLGGLDDEAGETTRFCDVGVDGYRELREVALLLAVFR